MNFLELIDAFESVVVVAGPVRLHVYQDTVAPHPMNVSTHVSIHKSSL